MGGKYHNRDFFQDAGNPNHVSVGPCLLRCSSTAKGLSMPPPKLGTFVVPDRASESGRASGCVDAQIVCEGRRRGSRKRKWVPGEEV